jgi:hypothetical protein
MTRRESVNELPALLPHQAELIGWMNSPGEPRVLVLKSEPGLGRRTAMVAMVARLLRASPQARVLVITPAGLRRQFAEQLESANVQAWELNRFVFREVLGVSAQDSDWATGHAIVVGREFARLRDVREALAAVRWDLLIVDEPHRMSAPESAETMRLLLPMADRTLLATLQPSEAPNVIEGPIKSVEWRREFLRDQHGMPLFGRCRSAIHEVPYTLSQRERHLLDSALALSQLEGGGLMSASAVGALATAAASSPAAFEEQLRRWLERPRASRRAPEPMDRDPSNAADETPMVEVLAMTAEAHATVLSILAEIDETPDDSKLAALVSLVKRLRQAGSCVCVLVDYLSTMYYLATELEALDGSCKVLHGDMDAKERQQAWLALGECPVVATRASIANCSLGELSDLVLYDAPRTAPGLTELVDRVDTAARTTPLQVHLLQRDSEARHPFLDSP